MADTLTTALAPVANWWIDLIATYGPFPVVAVTAVVLLAVWCGIGAVIDWHATRRPEFREAQRVAQASARVGFTDQETADRAFVRYVEAELKDYAAIVADLYDTRGEL